MKKHSYYCGVSKDGVVHIVEYKYPFFKALCGANAPPKSSFVKEEFSDIPYHCPTCLVIGITRERLEK